MGGHREERFDWAWNGTPVAVGGTRLGSGPIALLLPALSSISTRDEMAPLAARLADRFETLALDWPGFGTAPKPKVAWSQAAMRAFLEFALDRIASGAVLVVAAGHGAGYLLEAAARHPNRDRRLVLVAPTWRGPLPTMLRRRPALLGQIARAGDLPGLGAALYRLNVNPPMVRLMARAHVYSDPTFLDGSRGAAKRSVIRARGARHAALRFVTGELDPFRDRAAMLAAAAAVSEPVLLISGAETPPKSRAEMEALAALPSVASLGLPRGKLAVHEEFAGPVADAILSFCDGGRGATAPAPSPDDRGTAP